MTTGPRGQFDVIGHVRITAVDAEAGVPTNNIIANAKTNKGKWLQDATSMIGPIRAEIRSTYIRWALSINGLCVASERYNEPNWQATHEGFLVESIRADKDGKACFERIALWGGNIAAKNHFDTVPMLVAYGIIDLYACLEEWIFNLYLVFLNSHPESLIKGPEFRGMRRLRRQALIDDEAKQEWEIKWSERIDVWQRKRMYDGLHKVFLAFFRDAKLEKPKSYTKTTLNTLAESIRLVAVLRNSLMHGAEAVNSELADLMGKPHSLGFSMKESDKLEMKLKHLQSIECFMDQLLNAVNLSLVEHPDAFM